MKPLINKGDRLHPSVEFSPQGRLSISGFSSPDDIKKTYAPLIDWVKAYVQQPAEETTLSFKMKYYNTSSSKMFLLIMRELVLAEKVKPTLSIFWYYEKMDEDMEEAAEELEEILQFEIKPMAY